MKEKLQLIENKINELNLLKKTNFIVYLRIYLPIWFKIKLFHFKNYV